MSGRKIIDGLNEAVIYAERIKAGADVIERVMCCEDRRWCEFVATEILNASDAVSALDGLPNVSVREGKALRTGEPEPIRKDIEDAKRRLSEGNMVSLEEVKRRLRLKDKQ